MINDQMVNDQMVNVLYRGTFDSNETGKANLIRAGVKIAIDFGWPKTSGEVTKDQGPSELETEAARLAAEKARQDSIAKANAKAEAERIAAEKAAREKAEADRLAREQAEKDRQARLAAERAARIAALKAKGETVTVHFDTGDADLKFKEGEQEIVDDIAAAMKEDASMKIVITGHTDNTGNAEKNLRYFGMKRAEALKNYMVKKGVPADQIRCESKGQTEPVADNATKEGRAQNRRANIRFL